MGRTAMMMAILVAGLAFAAAVARADAITEEQAQCNGKSAGDACGTDGACVTEQCGPGGSGYGPSHPCQICREGAPRKAGAAGASDGKGLYIGIAVAVSLIVCGLAFAYTRRRKPPA